MAPEVKRGPLNPAEAEKLRSELNEERLDNIPEEVYVVFNGLIAQGLSRGRAQVLQKDVVAALVEQGLTTEEIYGKKMLDVEDRYRSNGWKVSYDRPVYWGGEDFDAYFDFQAKDAPDE